MTRPDRAAGLLDRTEEALADLATLVSRDPAAQRAMAAVRLTAHTLRSLWVPALERVAHEHPASDAEER
jgi:hypothetical protein